MFYSLSNFVDNGPYRSILESLFDIADILKTLLAYSFSFSVNFSTISCIFPTAPSGSKILIPPANWNTQP